MATRHGSFPDMYDNPEHNVSPAEVVDFADKLSSFFSKKENSPPRRQPPALRLQKKKHREEAIQIIHYIYGGATVKDLEAVDDKMKLDKFLKKSLIWKFAEQGETTESLREED